MTNTDTQEKISFVLYGSYEEQIDMLTNEQAGELFKAIYVYVRTGEKHSDDPMVKLMLSVISHQLDIDAQKYAESKERRKEAGKKGGRPRKENLEIVGDDVLGVPKNGSLVPENKKDIKAMLFLENQAKDIKPVDVYVDDDVDDDVDVNVNVDEDADVDVDADVINKTSGGGEEEEDVCARAREIIHIIENQYPTTQEEVDKFTTLAEELFVRYCHKQPTEFDIEQVFENTYSRAELDDGTAIAAYDTQKAELLRYAFQLAANADKVNWGYINGIYTNFSRRNIQTVEDAYRYDWDLKYGAISA